MFRKNPLVELELNYLRQNRPHQKRHYFMLALALLIALAPLFYMFTRRDGALVQAMAFVILSVYWFVQWLIMKAAVSSANHELPDEMMGNYSKREILSAKIWAVLRHYKGMIVLVSIATLGLSLALMGYFVHRPLEVIREGFLSYIELYPRDSYSWKSPFLLPHPTQIIITGISLLIMGVVNSVLTVSLGLWFPRRERGFLFRLLIIAGMVGVFLSLFCLRETFRKGFLPFGDCSPAHGTPNEDSYFCQNLNRELTLRRIVESLQASSFSFLDGGIVVTTTILCPWGTDYERYYDEELQREAVRLVPSTFAPEFAIFPFMWRHLYADVLTICSQISLSAFLLWRTSRGMGKKKK